MPNRRCRHVVWCRRVDGKRIAIGVLGLGAFVGVACSLAPSGIYSLDGGRDAPVDFDASRDGSNDDDAGEASAGDGGAETSCPDSLAGPKMVPAADFCIDSTEVTRAQYAKFLEAVADAGSTATTDAGLPPECNWKTPSGLKPGGNWDPIGKPNQPVTNVDWCDAVAFCRWAGKRLCGRRGGGSIPWSTPSNDATQNQWYAACSQESLRLYAYGSTWDPTRCRSNNGGQKAADVGAYTQCVGGYPRLFDMTGNVAEWIDECKGTGSGDGCLIQGGDFGSDSNASKCSSTQERSRGDGNNDWNGFRCCL